MNKLSIALIGLAIVVLLGGGYWFFASKHQSGSATSTDTQYASIEECVAAARKTGEDPSVANDACIRLQGTAGSSATNQSATNSKAKNTDTPPLTIKSMPIVLAPYDEITGRAGDLEFPSGKLTTDLIFMDYGYVIPADISANGEKSNPQPTFLAPLGTKVRSLVDGVVVAIPELYSGDYSIQVSDSANSSWRYETEHVLNPTVKVGDRVTAGQVIAEVSDHDSEHNSGLGLVEIGILQGGNPPQHICPFKYLDASIAESTTQSILQLYKDWEAFRENPSLYNEEALATPGCLSLDPIEG